MSDWFRLQAAWEAAQQRGERALLFTLVDVVGSSYRKPGAHMLAARSGAIVGSVSAGCVEADLIARLPELFAGPLPQILSYSNITDDAFALNRGCNGDICIYIEEVLTTDADNSLSAFARAQLQRRPQVRLFDLGMERKFVERITPPVRLFIFGGQRDTDPVATIARSLDMEVSVLRKTESDRLASVVPDERTAVLVMSHDFDRDREALLAVAGKPFPYVGIMGPRYRTDDMLHDAPVVAAKLHYPVGLDIGAEGAEEIAVAILGELIQTFRRSARKVLTVVLAAGEAKRFGSPKQLETVNGTSFVRRIALETLQLAESAQTAVVLGAHAAEVESALAGLPIKAIYNDEWQSGMGSSIAAAARYATANDFSAMLITTCDQIHITRHHLAALLQTRATIAAAQYENTVGVPCYFDSSLFAELACVPPHEGAKKLLSKHADEVHTVNIPEAACDIDFREQLQLIG